MKKLFKISLITLLTSCALSTTTPPTRLLGPEAAGAGHGSYGAGFMQTTKATISLENDVTTNPLNFEKERIFNYATPVFGIMDHLDLYLNLSSETPGVFGAKLQVLGDNNANAKPGNISVSLFASAGSQTKEVDDDLFDVTGNTKTELNTLTRELGVLYGYRVDELMVFFLEALFSHYEMDGTITSDNTNLNGKKFNYEGKIRSFGAGALIDQPSYFARFALHYQKYDWDYSEIETETLGSMIIGTKW